MMDEFPSKSERRFKCSCGKSYLSYSALYTHVKYKHGGEAPEGTTLFSKLKRPRGRPKKTTENPPVLAFTEQRIDEIVFKKQGLCGHTKDPESILKKMKSPLYSKYLYWVVQNESKKQLKEDHTIDDVFALYLLDLEKTVSDEGFGEFVKYLHFFREYLNEKAHEIFEWDSMGEEHSSVKGPRDVPAASNVFIETYLPIRRGSNRNFGISFALHLCSWLFSHAYTTYKLTLLQQLC